jgi:signal peptidase I
LPMGRVDESANERVSERSAPGSPTPQEIPRKPSRMQRFVSHLTDLPMLIVIAFLIAVVIKTFVLQAFYIPSESMIPTLGIGDRVMVEKLSYRLHDARRGDVVVFARSVFGKPPDVPWNEDLRNFFRELLGLPTGGEEDLIKRIVAVGGDTIRYQGKPRQMYVNGDPIEEPYIRGIDRFSGSITDRNCRGLHMDKAEGGCRVPAGRIFVMGDNRSQSEDSRLIGPVDEDRIIGRAFVIIWPLGHFTGL